MNPFPLRRCLGIFILLVLAVSAVRAEVPDSLRLDHILLIAAAEPDRALALLDESEARGVSLPGEASEAKAVAYEAKGEYQTALAYARIALSEQSSKDDVELYRGNCERVISLLMRLGDYKEALRFCRVLRLKLAKEDAPAKDGASLARLEALAYREFGQKSLADSLMAVSMGLLSLDEGGHGPGGLAENYRILSAWAEEDGDYSSALEYADLWLRELSDEAASCGGRCGDLVLANLDAAVVAAEAGDRSRAAAYYAAARSGSMNMSARGSSPWDDPECQLLDARYNLLAGDEEYSMNILKRLAATAPDSGLRLRALRLMAGVKEARKDYRGALALSEQAGLLADSVFSAWKLDNALQLSAFYKERELRGELLGHKVEIRFQRTVILFAFILVALLSALGVIALIRNKAVKRRNLALVKLIEDYREAGKTSVEEAGGASAESAAVGFGDTAVAAAGEPVCDGAGVCAAAGEEAGEASGSVAGELAVPVGDSEANRADYIALRDLVRKNNLFLDTTLTRDKVVQLSGMNRNRLARVIQEYSGTNFSGFINLMRLDYSLTLLEKGDSTVESVALDSGFGNVRTYHRLFKERFGMTPAEYREASAHLLTLKSQTPPSDPEAL